MWTQNGLFPLVLIKIVDILAPKLAVVFHILIQQGSFPVCWCTANVTALSKSSSPSQTSEYRSISFIPILSNIFECLLVKHIFGFIDRSNVLPPTQFGFRKVLGTCDGLLHLTHDLQLALDKGFEARIVSLDFSSAFDSANHAGLIFKLQSIVVDGLLLNI